MDDLAVYFGREHKISIVGDFYIIKGIKLVKVTKHSAIVLKLHGKLVYKVISINNNLRRATLKRIS